MQSDNSRLVTIGLPFYNNERTLLNAINSVLHQTFENWELLLIDDGSTDNSESIALKMSQRDSRITLINDGTNKGLVDRLNQIIDLANGEYIARMDADDMMMPTKLEKQLKVFAEKPDIDIVATAAYTIDENDNPIGIRGTTEINVINKQDVILRSLLIHPTILVKKDWYKLNKYDPNYIRAEDYELWCRSFNYTKFYRIAEPLFLYREGNVSVKNYVLSMKTVRKIIKKYGKGNLGALEHKKEIAKTYFKSWLYQLMGFFNSQHILSARRNDALNVEQTKLVEQALFLIKRSS